MARDISKWGTMAETKIFKVNWRSYFSERLTEGFKSLTEMFDRCHNSKKRKKTIRWCSSPCGNEHIFNWLCELGVTKSCYKLEIRRYKKYFAFFYMTGNTIGTSFKWAKKWENNHKNGKRGILNDVSRKIQILTMIRI